ncbi:envelope stress response membrane protein PspB [Novosphingobium sp.]|uniref:envelope stress response membrane protein PspB n=1 Tax=Novosphingobium sp. TaxID=1874826 RepID=UPI0022C9D078|nr:envelope stress response membrane protein PspB [Novosphingobium sp.]MCZ8019888.1 envelope stress response membrane protein PspB [Novosphingobium sp.]MCZ8035786.1 envelope stress response membrane protein PspB [Novosphingobium sp.]MCZ8052663.1 envelope stress response membrane protein PspB [Novosphingobium sp.]MCZ8060767.1 envelope stress response membrane protein PspB [Novosphingobium sp.]MCZ8233339.1 envelope stress response membrane protein PspB [Novosphingobium sp.]
MDDLIPLIAIVSIFVGLPWLILHYVTKWKTAATLTTDDEAMLEELYNLARRLEDRVETVERLVASDHPDFRPNRLAHELSHDRQIENRSTRDFDQMVSNKGRIGQ